MSQEETGIEIVESFELDGEKETENARKMSQEESLELEGEKDKETGKSRKSRFLQFKESGEIDREKTLKFFQEWLDAKINNQETPIEIEISKKIKDEILKTLECFDESTPQSVPLFKLDMLRVLENNISKAKPDLILLRNKLYVQFISTKVVTSKRGVNGGCWLSK